MAPMTASRRNMRDIVYSGLHRGQAERLGREFPPRLSPLTQTQIMTRSSQSSLLLTGRYTRLSL